MCVTIMNTVASKMRHRFFFARFEMPIGLYKLLSHNLKSFVCELHYDVLF